MYRLKLEDINGTITCSNVVTVMYGNGASLVKTGITVYPNPAKNIMNLSIATGFNPGITTASIANPAAGKSYDIQIANILGSAMEKTTINQLNWQTDVSALMPGTYIITVTNNKDKSLVGKAKFIKL
ncbi:T9SS type A sorting domain-containing protein [uncultured Mucilaginibacter sp.]|uniref:T9SS type A sorting domain-containing protein n=1 Tax=uncultured Mucilaginibacter sp. TaxID=797541 RepID=UPI0025CDB303|nr:T9SS type A sorting domain-containing protein [uncultured Mucilaginibacter sp.]